MFLKNQKPYVFLKFVVINYKVIKIIERIFLRIVKNWGKKEDKTKKTKQKEDTLPDYKGL